MHKILHATEIPECIDYALVGLTMVVDRVNGVINNGGE